MTMIWRFLGIAFALLLVVVVILLITFGTQPFPLIERVLFGPDGHNLLQNGGFESGNAFNPGPDETFTPGPNTRILCDHSTSIEHWVPSGPGPGGNNRICSNGLPFNALTYVANPDHCEPNVPPCPNSRGVSAQEGNRFVNLTGDFRPPAAYGTVSQDVPTEVGKRYEVSFFIGSSSNNLLVGDKSGAVFVEIAGVTIPNNPFPAPPPQMASNWPDPHDAPRFRFTAVNETTTLKFSGTTAFLGAKGTAYIGLDNVSLQKVCVIWIAILFGCP
jgi:hypothetical protein